MDCGVVFELLVALRGFDLRLGPRRGAKPTSPAEARERAPSGLGRQTVLVSSGL
jgi:hypothetical protein